MPNVVSSNGSLLRRMGSIPAAGYPLLLAWKRGWIPVPSSTTVAQFRDGRTLYCKFSDATQRTMALGLYEPAESRLVARILGPGDTFIDVGAHIGWFTTIASRCVGKDGLVISCEPYPGNATVLKENLALNEAQNVRLVEMAVGSQSGMLCLHIGDDSGGITALDWVGGERVEARVTTLDEVAAESTEVTLLKMDVEGWESHVLRGGRETLARTKHVLFEINRSALHKAGSSAEELYGLLREAGFTIFAPVAQRGMRRMIRSDELINVLASK